MNSSDPCLLCGCKARCRLDRYERTKPYTPENSYTVCLCCHRDRQWMGERLYGHFIEYSHRYSETTHNTGRPDRTITDHFAHAAYLHRTDQPEAKKKLHQAHLKKMHLL